jgi:hypothetical protein
MAIISNITALQTAIVSRLASDSFFTGAASPIGKAISVIAHQPGDIAKLSEEEVLKISLVVIVMVPIGKTLDQSGRWTPSLLTLTPVKVLVSENGVVNRGSEGTQVAATDVIGRVLELLHFWEHGLVPPGGGSKGPLTALIKDSDVWTLADKDPMMPQYFVNFFTYLPIKTMTV